MRSEYTVLVKNGRSSSVSITRPNDTTAYAVGDVVGSDTASGGAVLTFSNVSRLNGGAVLLSDVCLRLDVASAPSGLGAFRLHLYSASPASALGDNAAWDLPAGDRSAYLGYVDINTPTDMGSTQWSQGNLLSPMAAALASSATTLYGYLETRAAFTPTAQAVKMVRMVVLDA